MVEGARLESVYAGDRIVGSNPILSAKASVPKNLINNTLDVIETIVPSTNILTTT